ncbi:MULTISPECIES: hypothetical protein [Ramlibacter]|uniref:Uncharacterized protein n=1 Tax=Ramlibacter pinisoli TaxID=2682844 RepID=A0A6N8IY94_9BURK|nr:MULTISPECIES: hypothetical protein [Ramlibacter]MBA2960970.1 hypothetical protein [Ramlibacter sp. CGMCC 1.13660]MVQ30916.1 hypothetical protein [Ramlibacter pinisoli]
MAHPDLPKRGTRITTAEGDWEVLEVMLLGREPLHYAVRVACTPGAGGSLSLMLSRMEFEALLARASTQAPTGAGGRGKAAPRR